MANDRPGILALGAFTCWLALASPVAAQTILGGVVRYPTGQVAANVTVVAEKEDTGEIWDTRSSSLGLYAFYRLPNGTYTIRVILSQLSFTATGVEVLPRQKTALDIPLCICRHETVIVRSASALPRAHRDGSGGAVFSREAIESMSLTNGPNLQSILSAIPGIVFTESIGTLAQFTAVGQPRFSNRISIDGISADLAVDVLGLGVGQAGGGTLPAFSTTGSTQTLIPLSAIDEIQIRTTNASSAYARTPGAQTDIVTRSGSDRFQASVFTHARPEGLAATDWFINAGEQPERRARYWDTGASLGGPILPRRLLYYGTWEHQRIDRSVGGTWLVPSLGVRDAVIERPGGADVSALLNSFPVPNGPALSTEQGTPLGAAENSRLLSAVSHLSSLSIRLDWNLSSKHRSFIRVSRGDSSGDALDDRNLPSFNFTNTEATTTTTTTGGLNSAWSTATHELRVGTNWHRGTLTATTSGNPSLFPMASLAAAGLAEDAWVNITVLSPLMTIQSGRYASNSQKYSQVSDTWSLIRGRHEWRFGFEYRYALALADGADSRYVYRFRTLAELINPGRFQLLLIDRALPSRARKQGWSVFAQDSFRISPRLTLDYGVRYGVRPAPTDRTDEPPFLLDYTSLPEPRPAPSGSPFWKTSWTDLAPRLVATYQLTSEPGREAALRAGWNLAFDERISAGYRAFGGGYPYASGNERRNGAFPLKPEDLVWVAPQTQFGSSDISNYFAFPTNLKAPRTYEWQVGFDRALGRTQQVSLGYVGTAARDLIYQYSHDLGTPIIYAYSNDGRSDYHALLVDYVRRRSRGIQGRISYAWSHAIDLDSGENVRPNAPPSILPPTNDRASADFDRTHVLRVSASYGVPTPRLPRWLRSLCEDWQIDMIGLIQSGTPVSIGTIRNFAGGFYELRPDALTQEPTWVPDSESPTGWRINDAKFAFPENGQGTLGRNTFRGSTLRQVDLSLSRPLRLKRIAAQLRLDAFNVFNIPNFAPPNGVLGLSSFGRSDRSYADGLGTGTLARGGLVPIHQVGGPRSLQVGLRLTY